MTPDEIEKILQDTSRNPDGCAVGPELPEILPSASVETRVHEQIEECTDEDDCPCERHQYLRYLREERAAEEETTGDRDEDARREFNTSRGV